MDEEIKVDEDDDEDFFSAPEAEERVHALREGAWATRSLLTMVQWDSSCPPSTRSRRPTRLIEMLSPEATMVRDLGGVMEERFMTCVEHTMDGDSVDAFGLRMVWKHGDWLVTGIGGGFCGVCAARKGMYFEDPYFE